MPETSGLENKLPVFTSPHQQITFYADDVTSLRQILTIINPYDFHVKFRILVSAMDISKYTVSNSQGSIKPHHSVDIILQHRVVTAMNIGITDTVRVHIQATERVTMSGKKDLGVTLLPSAPRERLPPAAVSADFQQLEADPATVGQLRQRPFGQNGYGYMWLKYSFICMLCFVIMAMPIDGQQSEYFPSFIPKPTPEMKYVATYVLGIMTVLLINV